MIRVFQLSSAKSYRVLDGEEGIIMMHVKQDDKAAYIQENALHRTDAVATYTPSLDPEDVAKLPMPESTLPLALYQHHDGFPVQLNYEQQSVDDMHDLFLKHYLAAYSENGQNKGLEKSLLGGERDKPLQYAGFASVIVAVLVLGAIALRGGAL